MRIVKVKHRNGLGEREYCIYETVEQLNQAEPHTRLRTRLSEAMAGDFVLSANGWIVPLLQTTDLVNKYYKKGFERKKRKTEYSHRVFHFPKQKFCVPMHKLDDVEFNYKPRDGKDIAGTGARNRMYEVTQRKIRWAQAVAGGMNPMSATVLVYPSVNNKNKLTKSLLLNDKLIAFIEEKTESGFRKALKKQGLDEAFIIGTLKAIVEDKTSNPKLQLFALQMIAKVLLN